MPGRIAAIIAVALGFLLGSSALAPAELALQESSPVAGTDCPTTSAAENEDLVQRLDPTRPVVAVFGPGFASPIGFQHVHRVTSSHSMLGVVFAVYELSTDVLQQALRAGARDAVVIGGEAEATEGSQK